MKSIVASFVIMAAVGSIRAQSALDDLKALYESYVKMYPTYSSAYTFEDFEANFNDIQMHNQKSGYGYKKDINQFTGMNINKHKNLLGSSSDFCPEIGKIAVTPTSGVSTKDWRKDGINLPLQEQGLDGGQVAY